jgi:hypothetical protein
MFPTTNQILRGIGTSFIVADKGERAMLICDDVLLISMENSSIFTSASSMQKLCSFVRANTIAIVL